MIRARHLCGIDTGHRATAGFPDSVPALPQAWRWKVLAVMVIARRRCVVLESVESVWDYPRPPLVVPCDRVVRVELGGAVLAESDRVLRVLETSHPPTIYLPADAVRTDLLRPSAVRGSACEFKGTARYLDAVVAGRRVEAVGWRYPDPAPGYEVLCDHVAFYPGRVDCAWIGGEVAQAQAGDFYGGWITSDLVGPFKGAAGTHAW